MQHLYTAGHSRNLTEAKRVALQLLQGEQPDSANPISIYGIMQEYKGWFWWKRPIGYSAMVDIRSRDCGVVCEIGACWEPQETPIEALAIAIENAWDKQDGLNQ